MKKKQIRQIHLQTVLFIAFTAVAVLFMLVFICCFYKYQSNILISQELASLESQATSFQAQIDDEIEKLDGVSINMNYSSALRRLLGEKTLDLSDVSISDFEDLCTSINGVNLRVDQINLYDLKGRVLRVGENTSSGRYIYADNPYVEEALAAEGSKVLSEPYDAYYLRKNSGSVKKYISLYRTYSDSHGNRIGVVETARRCDNIFRSITNYKNRKKDQLDIHVYTADGICVYPYEGEEEDSFSYFDILSKTETLPYFYNPDTEENEIIVSATSSYVDWTVVLSMPESQVLASVYAVMKQMVLLCAILLILSLFLSFALSHMLIQPIRQFQEEIKQTAISNLSQETLLPRKHQYKELYDLNQSFGEMRSKLKISMDELIETRKQEIKSRTMALQSQINPHFYYNSLASVIALAENDRKDEVIRMCRNLTKIMRYITNTKNIVTIQDEIDYVNQYLDCMKIRYQSSLNYMIDIDDDMLEENIPRLLIQPLVENAVKYGIDSEPPWGIAIHGYLCEGGWRIEVMDSGRGFSEEALQTIWERIKKAEDCVGLPEMQIEGMGTLNVYLRWRLFAQEDMIFEVGNTSSGHGIVTIGRKRR